MRLPLKEVYEKENRFGVVARGNCGTGRSRDFFFPFLPCFETDRFVGLQKGTHREEEVAATGVKTNGLTEQGFGQGREGQE